MAPKVNKEKGVASSSHGSKRARRTSDVEYEYMRMTPQPLRRYGLRWVTKRVGPRYEEPLDDDVAIEDKIVRVNSDIKSSDDNDEDSEMGEATLAHIDDEE
ncbi:hypothetical protein HAX54_041680 [Datura stramonium]|uniref:Uncharacterized protein n=1 Tax=Datura stramonium TaxID=4076 RepID=A0ABS8SLG4_DATST|nr:hypothetical protein [Datura stramonium]